jgi:large subunit ribosomal protein L24
MRIRKNDTVYVLSGKDRGKTGRVLWVDTEKSRILVEGVNQRKKHQRPSQKNPKGGIVTKEASIHLSNVALYSSAEGGPVKITTKVIEESGKKHRIRVSKKTGEEI